MSNKWVDSERTTAYCHYRRRQPATPGGPGHSRTSAVALADSHVQDRGSPTGKVSGTRKRRSIGAVGALAAAVM